MRALLLVAGLAASLMVPPADAKPNFSGVWKLDLSRSEFGPLRRPKSRTDRIAHQEPSLKLNITQQGRNGEFSYELRYTTDGRENHNDMLGNPLRSRLKWADDVLVIETQGTLNGNDVSIQDHWTLSTDGNTLTVQRHLSGSRGATEQKLVFDKQ